MEEAELLKLAGDLCGRAGLAAPTALERLAGGKNNRVFQIALGDNGAVVLKSYFHDPRDTRDRLEAEWAFLNHAWSVGVHIVPRPLAADQREHAALYSLLEGHKLSPAEVLLRHVDAASSFIYEVNRTASPLVQAMKPASEACLSISQHLATVDRRIERLSVIAADAPHREEAERMVSQTLKPAWAEVRSRVITGALKTGMVLEQGIGRTIISPSDFGFHNTLLRPDGELQFLDFEYAGFDDPAKLVGDFYACPEIPTPQDTFERFVDRLVLLLEFPEAFRDRARLLRDAYRVKWACIILNDFLPSDDARRAFAGGEERAARCAAQLRKAEAKIAEIG